MKDPTGTDAFVSRNLRARTPKPPNPNDLSPNSGASFLPLRGLDPNRQIRRTACEGRSLSLVDHSCDAVGDKRTNAIRTPQLGLSKILVTFRQRKPGPAGPLIQGWREKARSVFRHMAKSQARSRPRRESRPRHTGLPTDFRSGIRGRLVTRAPALEMWPSG